MVFESIKGKRIATRARLGLQLDDYDYRIILTIPHKYSFSWSESRVIDDVVRPRVRMIKENRVDLYADKRSRFCACTIA